MKYQEYLDKFNSLMDTASQLANEGKFDEAGEVQKEAEALNEQWDRQAKAEADIEAMRGQQRKVNLSNMAGVAVKGEVIDSTKVVKPLTAQEQLATDNYENAWAKMMLGRARQMTAAESEAFEMVNDAIETGTLQTSGGTQTAGSILIPANVSQKIIRRIEELHPLINDVKKTYIQGLLTLTFAKESSAAGWYEEDTETADGSETFRTVSLGGCELARKIVITYKMSEMAVADFITYIVEEMAKKMGEALAIGVISGLGARSGYATQPTGILTALAAEASTPQILTGTGTGNAITEMDLAKAMGKIPSVYRPKWYASRATIWGALYGLKNGIGDSIMVADPINGGVYRIFGAPVVEEAGIPDGQVLLCDAGETYHLNFNKQIILERDKDISKRQHIFAGYAIADGTVIASKAAVLVKNS